MNQRVLAPILIIPLLLASTVVSAAKSNYCRSLGDALLDEEQELEEEEAAFISRGTDRHLRRQRRSRGQLLRTERRRLGTVIHQIRKYAMEGTYTLSTHARHRSVERGIKEDDILWVLKNGTVDAEKISQGMVYKVLSLLPNGRQTRVFVAF